MNCKNFSVLKVNARRKINLQDENDVMQRRMTQFAKYHTAFADYEKRGVFTMASTVPEAKEALNRFKMEAASEVGVNLKQGYNGDLTAKQAGSVGGQMVNVMCPVRTVQFQRTNWAKNNQLQPITYEFCIAV